MASEHPVDRQAERRGPPGRLRSALACLRGQRLVPEQIEWDWIEYQQRFNGLLDQYKALLARDAKRIHKLESEEEASPSQSGALAERKDHLRQRLAAVRGLPGRSRQQGSLALQPETEENP